MTEIQIQPEPGDVWRNKLPVGNKDDTNDMLITCVTESSIYYGQIDVGFQYADTMDSDKCFWDSDFHISLDSLLATSELIYRPPTK
jgi:hypothetical protein